MNTKGTKFLAVLAVLAMAFASVAVISIAEESSAEAVAQDVGTFDELKTAIATAAANEGNTYTLTTTAAIIVSENLTVGSNVVLRINPNYSLTIAEGKNLTSEGEIRALGNFVNNGTFTNYGSLIL